MTDDMITVPGKQDTVDSPGPARRAADGLRSVLTGEAARALRAGSLILARKGWHLVAPDAPIWQRLGYVALGGYATVYGAAHTDLGPAGPFLVPGGAIVWCVAAWTIAPPPGRTAPQEQPDRQDDDEPEDTEHGQDELLLDREFVVALIRKVAGDRHGAHLADLIATGDLDGWEQHDLKAALTREWGIPVAEIKLKFGGRQRVRDGVRLRDLPAPPEQHPAEAAPEAALDTLVGAPSEGPSGPSPHPLPDPSQGPR
ncbi:ubiquitin-like domain-containing protein [Streptomyces sp. NPDC093109]|uniref:ubiquitin-like domain-containing protein n=1 Tax=Streptomyces sp. NPDC093109 TaxID=3154977 RepID=UPI00344D5D7F